MRLIDVIQRTRAWERWRAGGVTASEAAIVLGRSPYKTPWRVWAERTGVAAPPDLSQNPRVARGVALEDAARQWFEARHDTLLLPVCAESDAHPVLRASSDGLGDDGAPVELKAPAEKTFAEVAAAGTASRAYAVYWPQLQHQLYVAGADHGWLVFYGDASRADLKRRSIRLLPAEISSDLLTADGRLKTADQIAAILLARGVDRDTQVAQRRPGSPPSCSTRVTMRAMSWVGRITS